MQQPVSILLIDDHDMVIEGMKAILKHVENVQVVATANNAFDAISILKKTKIDLCFLDINLPDVRWY